MYKIMKNKLLIALLSVIMFGCSQNEQIELAQFANDECQYIPQATEFDLEDEGRFLKLTKGLSEMTEQEMDEALSKWNVEYLVDCKPNIKYVDSEHCSVEELAVKMGRSIEDARIHKYLTDNLDVVGAEYVITITLEDAIKNGVTKDRFEAFQRNVININKINKKLIDNNHSITIEYSSGNYKTSKIKNLTRSIGVLLQKGTVVAKSGEGASSNFILDRSARIFRMYCAVYEMNNDYLTQCTGMLVWNEKNNKRGVQETLTMTAAGVWGIINLEIDKPVGELGYDARVILLTTAAKGAEGVWEIYY